MLRAYADFILKNKTLSWGVDGKIIFKMVKEKNSFLWFLLAVEGLISNAFLFGLIVSIPIFFIWKI